MFNDEYVLDVDYEDAGSVSSYRFVTADGVHAKTELRQEETVLLDNIEVSMADSIVVSHGNYGFLPVILGDRMVKGEVVATERSKRAGRLIRENAAENDVGNVDVVSTTASLGQRHSAAVFVPRPYQSIEYVKNEIANLISAVKNGYVFIAGTSSNGMNRYRAFLEGLPGTVLCVEQQGDVTVYAYESTGREQPPSSDITYTFTVAYDEVSASFQAEQGLFSKDSLDEGSRLLLDNLSIDDGDAVLDAACGYGAIGVLVGLSEDVSVTMTDDDVVATEYARRNAAENGLACDVYATDCLDGFTEDTFDCVVSNPPTHAGSGVTKKLLSQAADVLRDDGRCFTVYSQGLRYDNILEEFFTSVDVVAETEDYVVTCSTL